jgi:hypothetical protein
MVLILDMHRSLIAVIYQSPPLPKGETYLIIRWKQVSNWFTNHSVAFLHRAQIWAALKTYKLSVTYVESTPLSDNIGASNQESLLRVPPASLRLPGAVAG